MTCHIITVQRQLTIVQMAKSYDSETCPPMMFPYGRSSGTPSAFGCFADELKDPQGLIHATLQEAEDINNIFGANDGLDTLLKLD